MKKNKYLALLSIGLFIITPGIIKVDAQLPASTNAQSAAIHPIIVKVWITAYSSTPEQTKSYGSPFITASNKHVQDGFVAANFLPFGTKIQIPSLFGDKIFTVEDRMSRTHNNFVDIWMPHTQAAIDFGINHTEIVILNLKDQRSIPNYLLAEK